MTNFAYPLPTSTLSAFNADGFVVTPTGLAPDELKAFGAAVDEEVAKRTEHDHRSLADKNRYEQSFVQCMRLWETNEVVRRLTLSPELASMAAQLLGVSSVRLWQDQALYKEAGGAPTTPHQDLTFWPIGEEALVSVWIPFDDVELKHGAMSYVPGSHLHGRLKVVDITHTTEPYDILNDPLLKNQKPRLVEVKAGQAIWHHGLTVHQAAANTSDQTRRVFTIVYIDAEARRHQAWPAYPLDRDNVGVGEVIAGDGMPVVWPEPTSAPEPPAKIGEPTGPQYEVP